jgi:hypothetical protein
MVTLGCLPRNQYSYSPGGGILVHPSSHSSINLMRYMRYVGLKNTLLPHRRQRQRSTVHIGKLSGVTSRCIIRCYTHNISYD